MKIRTHQFNDFLSVLAQVLVFWVSICLPNVATKEHGYTLVGFNRSGKLAAVIYLIMMGSMVLGYAQTTRYVATTGSNTSNNCSNSAAPCQTISHAISQAAAGDVIEVAAGTYSVTSTITVNKRLTIQGAGSGNDSSGNTIIQTTTSNIALITISVGGSNDTNRQTLKNLHITGASGGTGNTNSGIFVSSGGSYLTFENLTTTVNSGNGIAFNVAGSDIKVIDCNLSANGNAGLRLAPGSANFQGIQVKNCTFSNNGLYGMLHAGSSSSSGFTIEDCTFTGNGVNSFAGSTLGYGDLSVTNFNGNAIIKNVIITGRSVSDAAMIGMQISGASSPLAASGTISIENVTISGAYRRPNGSGVPVPAGGQGNALQIQNYSNVSGISFTDVMINNADAGHGLVSSALSSELNIGNTQFGVPTATAYGGAAAFSILNSSTSTGRVNAENASFANLNKTVVADNYQIANYISDAVDNGVQGYVSFKTNEVFVTTNSFATPTTTTPSIQRAVTAANTGNTIRIQPGVYSGTVNAATPVKDITLSPSASSGCATINGSLSLNSGDVLDVEVGGTTSCTGYDKFIVNGGVTLNGATLNLALGYTPTIGDAIMIIENDGTDAVVGMFAQGTAITIGAYLYQIDYAGGTGNDVMLTSCEGKVQNTDTGKFFCSIQAAITDATTLDGHTIVISPGMYTENITLNKRLTLQGAGSGTNPLNNTIIQSAAPNLSVIRVTIGGVNATDRQVLKNLRLTGANGGTGINHSGLEVRSNSAIGYFTFENIASVGNSGNGIATGGNGAFTDLKISNSTISQNGNSGIRIGTTNSINGLEVLSSEILNNVGVSLSINPGDGNTHTASNILLSEVAIGGTSSVSDCYIYGLDGQLSLSDVSFTGGGTNALYGLMLSGQYYVLETAAPAAPSILLNNVNFSGNYQRSGISFWGWSDLSNVSMLDVKMNETITNSVIGAHLILGAVAGELNLGDTNFDITTASRDILLTGSSLMSGSKSTVLVDALNAQWSSSVGVDLTTLKKYEQEDRIVHALDDSATAEGLVRFHTGNHYVTPNSGSIQRAIDAALSGDIINIFPSIYTENVDAVTSAKNLTLSPGSSPGCVTITGNLTLNSGDALDMEINGNTPCTGHDQFIVNGTVALGGATLNLTLGYSMGANDAIVLIENDDTDAVVGQFDVGTTFIINGIAYKINYAGGDGNDVVLSRNCADICTAPITYTGNITLSTQTQVSNFKNGSGCKYTHITGNLTMYGDNVADPITDLCNLSELVMVGGDLFIERFTNPANPTNLNDLANLTTLGDGSGTDELTIGGSVANQNTMLTDISLLGLQTIASGPLNITHNPGVTNISLPTLTTVSSNATIQLNGTGVTAINLANLQSVGGNLNMINNAANAISATVNLSSLSTVGLDLNITRTAASILVPQLLYLGDDLIVANNTLTAFNAPLLSTINGAIEFTNNLALTSINIPTPFISTGTDGLSITGNTALQSVEVGITATSASVIIGSNGTGVTSITLKELVTVGNDLTMSNTSANAVNAIIDLSKLVTCVDDFTLNRTASALTTPLLQSVNDFNVSYNTLSGALSFPAMATISSELTIVGNPNITSITIPTLTGGATEVLTVTGNTSLQTISIGVTAITLDVDVQTNGSGVTQIDLSDLVSIGRDLSMSNTVANTITAAIDLSSLTSIGDDVNFTRTAGSIVAANLATIGGDFVFTLNNSFTNFDVAFSGLTNVGTLITDNFSVTNNSSLSQCCVIPCQLTISDTTPTVSGNTGNCLNLSTAQTNCQITANITGSANVCEMGSVTLNGNPSGSTPPFVHHWSITGGTGGATFVNHNNGTATFTGTGVGTVNISYYATGATSCTSNTATFTLTVDAAPGLSACPLPLNIGTSAGGTGDCLGKATFTHPDVLGLAASCSPAVLQVDYNLGGGWQTVTPAGTASVDFPVATTTVNYQLLDVNNNVVSTCSFTVTVSDDEAPTFTCPSPTMVLNTTGNNGCEITIPDLVAMVNDASDNCGLAAVPVTQSIAAGAYSGVSDGNTINVVVTVTDAATPANTSTCTVTFTVNDNDAPTFTCPSPTLVLNTTGNSGCEVTIPDLVAMVTNASDNCGLAAVPITQSIAAGAYSGVSDGNTIDVVVTVTDAATPPNTTTCTVTFTVNDDDAPTLTCPTPQTVTTTSNGT
ncbi:MAG TPA: right-handed parallel beta-helix repeat-containing protein, partial [Chitinophagales bacterium]|nr:right-handed parallel beta-helix repeat-containing protein [Chitinophagales bacterium]HRK28459.1 right-handed parallel beta-helix repeat-containing protein [Chitinophagales bacterium]